MSDTGLIVCLSLLTLFMFGLGYLLGILETLHNHKDPLDYKPSIVETLLRMEKERRL